jgi:hypothetical protein
VKDVDEIVRTHPQLTKEDLMRSAKPFQPDAESDSANGQGPKCWADTLGKEFPETEILAPEAKKIFLEFLRPSELRDFQPPEGIVLVGDNHITRGSVFVIGGAPGVGKSRATVALAEAGATSYEWFGLKVHSKFKTLIIQNENGRYRLKQEFSELDCETMDEFVRITPPPTYGLCFDRSYSFR